MPRCKRNNLFKEQIKALCFVQSVVFSQMSLSPHSCRLPGCDDKAQEFRTLDRCNCYIEFCLTHLAVVRNFFWTFHLRWVWGMYRAHIGHI